MAENNIFVDTNVWVARILKNHTFHKRAKDALDEHTKNKEYLYISSQIIREIISVCTLGKGLSRPLTWDELYQELAAVLKQVVLLPENSKTVARLVDLGKQYRVRGKQIHDANIAATMLANSISRILTFNPDDFKRFDEIEVIIP